MGGTRSPGIRDMELEKNYQMIDIRYGHHVLILEIIFCV
jgi:hypothetical protein